MACDKPADNGMPSTWGYQKVTH